MTILEKRTYEEEMVLKIRGESRKKGRFEPFIKIKFNGKERETLIDTGAQISAMTKAFYDTLNNENVNITVIPIRKFILKGAFLDKGIPVLYKVMIDFSIGNEKFTHGMYLVETLTRDFILDSIL